MVKMNDLQKIEINIFKEIKRICEKHNIAFQLIGGSMLGAARHKGFIPWDDDIDLGMLRDDYEKFLKVAENELVYPFALQTYKNTESHHYYFTHVVDKRYSVRRLGSMDKRVENVWVDIYPLDGMPNNPILRKLNYLLLSFDNFMYHVGYFEKVNIARPDRAAYQKIIISIVKRFYKLLRIDGALWRERLDRRLKKYPVESSKYLFNYIGVKAEKEIFPKDVFLETNEYQFEDEVVKGTKYADQYLSQLYGEWKNPPENKVSLPMEILFNNTDNDPVRQE